MRLSLVLDSTVGWKFSTKFSSLARQALCASLGSRGSGEYSAGSGYKHEDMGGCNGRDGVDENECWYEYEEVQYSNIGVRNFGKF